jgi:hypothetical protein
MTGNLTISSTYPRINLTDTDNDSDYSIINSDGAFAVYDVTNAANRLVVTSTGNLGIGTSSPGYKLDVVSQNMRLNSGASNAYALLRIGGVASDVLLGYVGNANEITTGTSAGDTVFGSNKAGANLRFLSGNGVINATLDSSGNLGLGVTPSAYAGGFVGIEIKGQGAGIRANGSHTLDLTTNVSGDSKYVSSGSQAATYRQQLGKHIWYTAPSGTAGSAISFTQAMTLDASGNLGIGTTSPSSKLDVVGDIRVNSINVFNGSSGVTTSTAQAVVALFAAATYGSGKFIIQATQGTVRHIIELLVVHDGTTAYATEYGMIRTGASLFTTDVDISAGNVRVLVTSTSATSTVYKISQNLMLA